MARPKAQFMKKLAERARADLDAVELRGLEVKLKAIAAAATHPLATVADIMGVTAQTVLRWVDLYRGGGVDGLQRRAKAPKPSKLSPKQKAAAISWLRGGKTPDGRPTHWTIDRLRAAIEEEFGVALGRNTIWVWLRKGGWKPKVPRPRHHKADPAAQAEFKKKRPS